MHFRQYYLGCLSHASYLVGDGGEAAVVDPQRDVDQYLADARALGLAIRHVLLTHVHADFVAGQCELARRAGARIWISHRAGATYAHEPVREGTLIPLGSAGLAVRALETPGHTLDSVTYAVFESGVPRMLFTGDTLFIGGVGRPDLVVSRGHSPEEMAGFLYDSLHAKILPLPDDVVVYPAHGAGSACGRGISSERSATLGEQRRANYALQPMTKAEFVALVAGGMSAPPRYFAHDVRYNLRGAPALGELAAPPPLAPAEVQRRRDAGAVVLDVRTNVEHGAGHVPGALNVGLTGSFASWAGTLIDAGAEIVLVTASAADVAEARMRLARVGLENVTGFLEGGMDAWRAAGRDVRTFRQSEPRELAADRGREPGLQVVDVRADSEFESGHVPGAWSAPLDRLGAELAGLDPRRPTAVICGSGYRSSAACGLLAERGFTDLRNVLGGTRAWIDAGLPVEKPQPVG